MSINSLIHVDRILCAVPCQSKKKILETISEVAVAHYEDVSQAEILASLVQRERMGSTGIGQGIAIPHGRLNNIDEVIAIVVTVNPGIDFEAIDNQPVDVFFALLVPEEQIQGHLQTLAEIAAKLSDKAIIQAIRVANEPADVIAALQ